MEYKGKKIIKRVVAIGIVMSMLLESFSAFAVEKESKTYQYLEDAKIDETILEAESFYFGSVASEISENTNSIHVMKIGRGGSAKGEASIDLKILDVTTKYGEDYVIRLQGSKEKVDVPKDNESLLDMIVEGADEAVETNETTTLLEKSQRDEETEEVVSTESEEVLVEKEEETEEETTEATKVSGTSLKDAFQIATGLESDKTAMDGGSQEQELLDSILQTEGINLGGATLTVDFKDGEKFKYIEIEVLDDDVSEGDEILEISLTNASEGMVIGGESSTMVHILDNEELESAKIYFSEEEYYSEDGFVTVVLKREGAISQVVGVTLSTADGLAASGRDYSQVETQVIFPFGITERTIHIPVNQDIQTGLSNFSLKLTDVVGNAQITDEEVQAYIISDNYNMMEAVATYSSSSILMHKNPVDLDAIAYSAGSNCDSSSYASDDEWKLYAEGGSFTNGSAWIHFNLAAERYRYDISGFTIKWKKESGKPSYGYALLQIYSKDEKDKSNSGAWRTKFETETERWSSETDTIWVGEDILQHIYLQNTDTGGWTGKASTLTIQEIKTIRRPYEITLVQPESLQFLNKQGKKEASSVRSKVILNNGVNGKTTVFASSGIAAEAAEATVTFSLETTNSYARFTGLKIGNTVIDKKFYSMNDKSISLVVTNEFLDTYSKELSFAKNGNQGKMGKFSIQPILGYYDAYVKVEADNRANILVNGTSNNGKTKTYTYHRGDVIKFTTDVLKSESYISNGINFSKVKLAGEKAITGTVDYDKSVYYHTLDEYSYTVKPNLSLKDNKIQVVISEKDYALLNKNVGFLKNVKPVKNGTDYIFEVVNKDDLLNGTYYELQAVPLSSTKIIRWETNSEQNGTRYYAQDTLYYQAQETAGENIIRLTVKDINGYYVFKGNFIYAGNSINGLGYSDAFLDAEGVNIAVGQYGGVSDETGALQTVPIKGIRNDYLVYKTEASGVTSYQTIQLTDKIFNKTMTFQDANKQTITARIYNLGTQKVNPIFEGRPYVESLSITDAEGGNIATEILITSKTTYNFSVSIGNNNLSYRNSDGDQNTERVKKVEFVILDGKTNTEKFVFEAKYNIDKDLFEASQMFDPAEYEKYKASDRLFVRITTTRQIGNGMSYDVEGKLVDNAAYQQTVYAPVYTDVTFIQESYEEPVLQDIEVPASADFVELPVIGNLNMSLNIKKVNLTIRQLPDGGTRIAFGFVPDKTNYKTQNEKDELSDAGVKLGIMNLDEAIESVKKAGENLNADSAEKIQSPLTRGGISLTYGLYLDFGLKDITRDYHQESHTQFVFLGGGIYGGCIGSYTVTAYFAISVVPVYLGATGTMKVMMDIGMTGKEDNVMPSEITGSPTGMADELAFSYLVQDEISLYAFAGVGLCGTLGVRGGIELGFKHILNPTIQILYPNIDMNGIILTADIKFTIDALLFPIPVPAYSIAEEKFGYYKQVEAELPSLLSLAQEKEESESEQSIELKDRTESSKWVVDMKNTRSGFTQMGTQVLQEGGYDRANAQLIELNQYETLMVFIDDDGSRTSANRTALKYSIYDSRNGNWTTPQLIQDDNTADFEPNLVDVGDSIMISWTSQKEQVSDDISPTAYLKGMEVYTVLMDKASKSLGTIERLTNDEYYDSTPVGLYDDKSGDYIVYYLKSEVGTDYVTSVSPTTNESIIVYMLYDKAKGKWLRDEYYPNEVASKEDEEILINYWGGQRFLSAPIKENDMNYTDPIIMDFDAISYNGLGVYTYTVDKDNNMDTSADREVFVQVYSFSQHKTYHPIRVTNNNVGDANPQLARKGENTYLFWYQNESVIRYINVTTLVKNGINNDGSIKEDYEFEQSVVSFIQEDEGVTPTYATFKPYVDVDGNLYIVWLQSVEDADGNFAQEVFASAFIQDAENGSSWSEGVQLTKSGKVNDEFSYLVKSDGSLLVVNNQYEQDLSSDNIVKNYKLVATTYECTGSLDVVDVTYDEEYPFPESELKVTATIKNVGLKNAEGYTLNVYELKDGKKGSCIKTINSDEIISPSSKNTVEFIWNLPKDIQGKELLFEVSENGFDEVSVFRSEPIKYEAKYQITNVETKQNSDGIYATYRVVNVGNKDGLATDMNYISIQYNDLYNLTNEKDIYLKTNLGDLKAKEEVVATHKLDIEDDDIYYGRITSVIKVVDKDENDLSNYIDFNICLDKPLEVSVLEGREVVTIKVGESLDLNPYYSQQTYFKDGTFSYIVDDVSKVAIDGNKLVGLEEGETTVEVLLEPYGSTSEVLVKVVDEEQDTDVKLPQTGDYRDYSTVIVMLAILISVIILYYREKRKIRE